MHKFRKTAVPLLLCLLGAAATVAALELLLRLLPVGGLNVYAADPVADWPVHHMVPDVDYVHSTAWNLANPHRGHVNDMGYAAPFDYRGKSGGVALFGDSYVESLMNDYTETVQGVLPGLLARPQPVMQFGVSGSSLPDYLGVGALVAQRFRPDWAVLVLTRGDFTEGFEADDGHYSWQPTDPSLVRLHPVDQRGALQKRVRTLALFRYFRYNLKMSLARLLTPERPQPPRASAACVPEVLSADDLQLLRGFVERLPLAMNLPAAHVVLVFDSDRTALYAGRGAELNGSCPTRETLALTRLRELAAAQGLRTLDTAPLFTQYYRSTGLLLDHRPVDQHWNAAAHRLVATGVAALINGDEAPRR